jgi:hypothetical protein
MCRARGAPTISLAFVARNAQLDHPPIDMIARCVRQIDEFPLDSCYRSSIGPRRLAIVGRTDDAASRARRKSVVVTDGIPDNVRLIPNEGI